MLVFWDQRLAFLATPKTGSTAIETALESLASLAVRRPEALMHTPVAQFRRHIAPFLADRAGWSFTTVALIREPKDWLGSWFRSLRAEEDSPVAALDFDAFVRAWTERSIPEIAQIASQADFLRPEPGQPGVDRLFRYEDIASFVDFLEDRLGCVLTLPRLKVSPAGSLQLSPATEAALYRAAAEDMAIWRGLDPVQTPARRG